MKLTMWLKKRELNARRLAAERTGDDRAGWMEDAEHFQAALAAVEERDRLRSDAQRFQWLAERTAATGLARWVHPFQFLAEAVDERKRADVTMRD